MKIKEVEEITHITSKTIRFYEEKGLLDIQRNESGYRDYQQDDIIKLQHIKLLRRCGITIQQIKDILDNKIALEEALYHRISELDKEDLEKTTQKELCLDVIKAKGNYDELYKTIDILESDEYQEFIDELIETNQPSLGKQVMLSIILLGPILNSFLFLYEEQYDRLWFVIPLTFLSAICLTLSWQSFLKRYKFYNESWLKGILHTLLLIIVAIVGIIGMILFIIGSCYIQTSLFLTETSFMISANRNTVFFFLVIAIELFLVFLSFLSRYIKHPNYQVYDFFIPFIKRHKIIFLIMNIIFCYIAFINVTVFNPNEIVYYSTIHPQGITYKYQDVKSIQTGFYEHGFWFFHEKGEFYYKIKMNDNRVINIQDTQTIPEYEEDTYYELVVLDDIIMKYHPIKYGDDRFSKYLMMDQIYIDRFLSIVHNQ